MENVLVINPGSTSTKIAVYDSVGVEILKETIRHETEELEVFDKVIDQYQFRIDTIQTILDAHNISFNEFKYIVGRGGLLKPIPGGTWQVNDKMLEDLDKAERGEHASNLGAIIAYNIAKHSNIPSYIVDPVVVDELEDVARISGLPEIERTSVFHALNQKSTARRAAVELGKQYRESNYIVAHMGGGITVGAHKNGRVIDVNNGIFGEGPFSPERSGALPAEDVVNLCFSGKYTKGEIVKKIHGKGGMVAYLGTADARIMEEEVAKGNPEFLIIHNAMAYQVAKEIGSMAAVLEGKVDAIVLTGGLAYGKTLMREIIKKIEFIAKVFTYPGENEMEALFEGALLAVKGKSPLNEYK
ncbi:MAG TPA: butyrate kinase [Victivallales bacterium]|nr:butyrate kinase [Victivallales bacterium]